MTHKHQFDHGVLSDSEREANMLCAVVCKTCPFRVVIHGKLEGEDFKWARQIAEEYMKILPDDVE